MDTILEDLLTLQHENEMYIEQMKFALVAESYVYLRETGTELVLEANSIKEKISKYIKTLKEKVHNFVHKVKEFISNKKKDITKRIAARKNKKEKVRLKGYKPKVLDYSNVEDNIKKSLDEQFDAVNKLYDNLNKGMGYDDAVATYNETAEQIKTKYTQYRESVGFEEIYTYKVSNALDFFEKYNEKMYSFISEFEERMDRLCHRIGNLFSGLEHITVSFQWVFTSGSILFLCSRWTELATSIYRLSERIILA